ncbi:MAG: amino acid permease [Alphaproteobacteria bacterium]|nr:amino acid permease [Alphaproteobacteria bacterium]
MSRLAARLLRRKSVERLAAEREIHGLDRTLGPASLVLLGVGCIIGAGVYVMTGAAAAQYAGPAVILSFVLAGAACAFTGLCYAELASVLPVAGSSYSYAYASLGEGAAWVLGWLLMLEYGLAGAALAVGLSSYLSSLLAGMGVHLPAVIATSFVQAREAPGGVAFSMGGGVNLVAVAALAAAALLLVRGVAESALANAILVTVKLGILVAFVAVGAQSVDPHNWTPFVPPNQGGFSYGAPGVFRAASMLFFAYLGFETVSTAASEARDPQKDMPIGILGSLLVCTVVYVAVAAVLTGVAPYRSLGVADPIAVAVDHMGRPGFAGLVKLGAVMGLSSVLLVNTYGHSRICFAMSRDGLLPGVFGRLHSVRRTPWLGTLAVAAAAAIGAALLPISLLGDLVSVGTGLAFCIVAMSVIWLRNTRPDLARTFRVPLGGFRVRGLWIGWTPLAAIVLCLTMVGPVVIDVVRKALSGDPLPAAILILYALAGVLIYAAWGYRHSALSGLDEADGAEVNRPEARRV